MNATLVPDDERSERRADPKQDLPARSFSVTEAASIDVATTFGLWQAAVHSANLLVLKLFPNSKRSYFVNIPSLAHPICLRANTSDRDCLEEVFKELEHLMMNDVEDPRVIVDCGANVGYVAVYYLNQFPGAIVVALEPDPNNLPVAKINLIPYRDRSVLLQAAVWSSVTDLVLHPFKYGQKREWSTRVLPPAPDHHSNVKAVDLGTLMTQLQLETIDILKIDIEGAEEAIFSSNYEQWLDKVRNIVVELHDEGCEQVFFEAMSGYDYQMFKMPCNTVCRNIRRKDES